MDVSGKVQMIAVGMVMADPLPIQSSVGVAAVRLFPKLSKRCFCLFLKQWGEIWSRVITQDRCGDAFQSQVWTRALHHANNLHTLYLQMKELVVDLG